MFFHLFAFLNDPVFNLCMFTLFFFFKIHILVTKVAFLPRNHAAWWFLIAIVTASLFSDFSWIVFLAKDLLLPISQYFVAFSVRVAWIFDALFYFSLTLLGESLIRKKYTPSHYLFLIIVPHIYLNPDKCPRPC